MSYEAAVLWSVGRSLIAGVVCLGLARILVHVRTVYSGPPSNSGRAWGLSVVGRWALTSTGCWLVPFFVPGLVIGSAYRNVLLSFVQSPLLNELLYLFIVIAQLTPVVLLALEWLPAAPLGATGQFLRSQVRRQRSWTGGEWGRAWWVSEGPRQWTAGTLAALLCFQEVEVATLMQAHGWPEWIFTKQIGGVGLVEGWRFLILPVGYGLLLTVPTLWYWLWMGRQGFVTQAVHPDPSWRDGHSGLRGPGLVVAGLWGLVSWGMIVVWPFASLAIGAVSGRGVIRLRGALWQEIGDALVLGVTVTLILGSVLRRLSEWVRQSSGRPGSGGRRLVLLLGAVLLLPGLLGALSLGLLIFEISQRMGVAPSYSPGPLIGGLCLFLLPRALALHAMLLRNEGHSGLHLAQQMAAPSPDGTVAAWGQAIIWRMRDAGRFWGLAILFWWGYLELTLPELLRPSGMAPAPMRLYNLLHYDHRPGLAAMLAVVLAVPVAMVVLVMGLMHRHRLSGVKRHSSERHSSEMV